MQDFRDRWKTRARCIQEYEFDEAQCRQVASDFHREALRVWSQLPSFEHFSLVEFEQVRTDLRLALNVALSNYRKHKKGFWLRLAESIRSVHFSLVRR